ncbi:MULTISPECIES: ABC transporter permease [Paenibacillus]|uniref:Osmoprotectant transport system permease protein n=1 Tax=Paenibacillus pabuli TaxID=1472 RepID=A0A855Y972_9BACL|nr:MULTISPECIES: ABC transporter permease [Paenibacillus]PWW38891.1 osmoprotectant transport system permease protein [Paenibacillus pabuli]PXW06076.1 osmoprotectant transport system permease protein [Paenibacillus taichungensis]QLG40396.1 ABC transporter permease [Paenibacillus sp. E222]SEN71903.1 osmoprotectant transport system permease protein [Paenibacillus sp. OK076]
MIDYAIKHPDKLGNALLEHVEILILTMLLSVIIAIVLTILALASDKVSRSLIYMFSILYSIPSLALFAIMIPVTGLGKTTAITVLIAYNQYILLRQFIAALKHVEPSVIEAATGVGMSRFQILFQVQVPLAIKPLFTGLRLASVTTISMATIAAFINAGGLGTILNDGLRTMNIDKILWGGLLSAGLAIVTNAIFMLFEKRIYLRSER